MSHSSTALPRHAPGLHYHADLTASAMSSLSAMQSQAQAQGSHLQPSHKANTGSLPTRTSAFQLMVFCADGVLRDMFYPFIG
jgi:hypothetical protein